MITILSLSILLILARALADEHVSARDSSSPVVDLGYGLWSATTNETGQYYNFSNIRYAQPPVGNLRFSPPQAPLVNRSGINDGQDGRICPQGMVSWGEERSLFIEAYTKGEGSVASFTNVPPPGINVSASPPANTDPRNNEDCLFLDVLVPQRVFDGAETCPEDLRPVMVWVFGGGFYEGSKESQGDPAGFIAQSQTNPSSSPGIVYVAINYRLGALGWLSGPTFVASGGTANLGLYDQRFAFEWIQRYIHLFGGDPNRITFMGASAGAASGLHQITAYGGAQDAPFQQAFLQSPAFAPTPSLYLQEAGYHKFLQTANATSLDGLRAMTSAEIILANEATIFNTSYGQSGYGPVVDGIFTPQLPSLLLQNDLRAKNVRAVFSGHNTDEGLIFADPAIQNTSAFNEYLKTALLPDAQPDVLNYIENTLYPPVFDNVTGLGYNDTISRLATLIADQTLTCNIWFLLKSIAPNSSSAYLFEEGASLHAEETPYMFFNYGPTPDAYGFGLVNGTVAQTLQDWVLNFGMTGTPNGQGSPHIPIYGPSRTMGILSNTALGAPAMDPALLQRCEFWQSGIYY